MKDIGTGSAAVSGSGNAMSGTVTVSERSSERGKGRETNNPQQLRYHHHLLPRLRTGVPRDLWKGTTAALIVSVAGDARI